VVRYRTAAVKNTCCVTYQRSPPSTCIVGQGIKGQFVNLELWKWTLTFGTLISGANVLFFFWFKFFFCLGVEQAESRLRDGPAGNGPAVCDVPRAAPGRHDVHGGAGGGPVLPAQPGGSARRPGPPAPAPGSQREYLPFHS
jgi:hypothetical protein